MSCETGRFPRFQGGVSTPLIKKVPFLIGADGVVSKFQQKIRCASRISIRRLRDLLLTTPSAPLRNGIFLLRAQPPLLENGGEWTRLATNPSPPPRVATCRTVLKFDRVPLPLTILMPQSVVPPWSYIAAAVVFWLGWFFFGRVVRWWSKPESHGWAINS